MKIKLCGVRTVADALLCANEGADEIGVIFAAMSKRRVTVQEAKAIREALPARVPLVGVFLDASLAEVMRVAREIAPLVAESGVRTPEDARRLRALGASMLLVGEALSSAADPQSATRALVQA